MSSDALSRDNDRAHPDLPSLTSLRAAAALAVFAYHVTRHSSWLPHAEWYRYGLTGVAFFFVLSGFVLTWSTKPHDRPTDFWMRRVARVYPSHVVTAAIGILIPVSYAVTALAVAANLTLTQAWFPQWDVAFALNAPSWSLSCEAFFYLCAPYLIARLRTMATSRVIACCFAWVALCVGVGSALAAHSAAGDVYAYTNPLIRSGEFVTGVLLAMLVERGWRPRLHVVPVAFASGAVLIALSVLPTQLRQVTAGFVLLPVFGLVILSGAVTNLRGSGGLPGRRLWVYAGQVSFAFYLVHETVLAQLASFLGPGGTPTAKLLKIGIALVTATVLAVLLHHGVELPAQRAIRRWWAHRRARRVVPIQHG